MEVDLHENMFEGCFRIGIAYDCNSLVGCRLLRYLNLSKNKLSEIVADP